MLRIPVQTSSRSYDVLIGDGLLEGVGGELRKLFPDRNRVFVITVRQVWRPWGRVLKNSLEAGDFHPVVLEIAEGESSKSMSWVERLGEKIVRAGGDRKAIIVSFGGGMINDLAGLTASLYMRGIDLVSVPTTVLAQVDASVGGKTAVNLRSGKNLLGTFHQPAIVVGDTATLSTLSSREFRSGLYEALKAGVIGSPALFRCFVEEKDRILQRDPETMRFVISEAVRVKARIVAADERDTGLRRVLNLGHTIGHAIEAQTRYRQFLHGEAVGCGMMAAARIGAVLGKLDARVAQVIIATVLALGKLPAVEARTQNLLDRLRYDKKTVEGVVHFVVPTCIGKVEVVRDVPDAVVADAIEYVRRLSRSEVQVQQA